MRATAFCPGHLTGFFFPCENADPLRSGSRGAGLCVDRGATTTVTACEGRGEIRVSINGRSSEAPVTRSAATWLLDGRSIDLTIDTTLALPASAGFGMSAAGALSSALALTDILELPAGRAFEAAHRAELHHRTGLGDVAALTRGGLTFRRKEGLPPYGQVDRLAGRLDIITAVVGEKLPTAHVLGNQELRSKIDRAGRECYRSLDREPTVDNFFRTSRQFTDTIGIATPPVVSALEQVDAIGQGSMVMLGNSVFAIGDLDALDRTLSDHGQTYRLALDIEGPRVLKNG
jgi:pantoate kinase